MKVKNLLCLADPRSRFYLVDYRDNFCIYSGNALGAIKNFPEAEVLEWAHKDGHPFEYTILVENSNPKQTK